MKLSDDADNVHEGVLLGQVTDMMIEIMEVLIAEHASMALQ
jgi:hypothetical protein